ncbi:coiled-coil domain-containing protein 18 [Anopheles nili]|uniref:coiled-coil domain-containing protein 18 n=1 Tax=Anopheles nili TaxID=185578 RepID=UPI00237A7096|nr:coiled-coil domain-containing protein 18 [Anopheles nili]
MDSRQSNPSFGAQDATDLLASIIGQMPTSSSVEIGPGPEKPPAVRSVSAAVIQQSKRLAKLKQKLDRQNNFMVELRRKIREKESMKPKADCDREELAFLRHRLQKEGELQRKLLSDVVSEQRQEGAGWQPIRLCPDQPDEYGANPWTLGAVPVGADGRFSIDSTLSPLSSDEMAAPDGKLTERFEKELMNRDRVIEILQNRLERLSVDVRKVRRDNDAILDRHPKPVVPVKPHYCQSDMMQRLEFYRSNTETLGQNLEQMDHALQSIQRELGPLTEAECPLKAASGKPRPSVYDARQSVSCSRVDPTPRNTTMIQRLSQKETQIDQQQQEQQQYTMLLHEYTKKTTECRQLSERLAKAQAGPADPLPEDTERELLKRRCSELLDEQDQFRVLLREQATQLSDYQARYMTAQQQVEEQRLQLDKLAVTNRRVEKQINFEIEQIKRKFQDKLRELTPYPRLLEEQEAQTEQLKHSNETLFAELERALRQVKLLEDRLQGVVAERDAEVQRAGQQAQTELTQALERLEALEREKQLVEQEAARGLSELDELRTESAKIVARTNERLEQERQTALQKYGRLEGELAQCRAEAAFTIANREQALREMHSQIKVLSSSFDDAQLQIRSLRNQLAYLQNEKLVCLA